MERPTYINTDLELSSKEDLSSIASELGNRIYVLVNEKVNNEYRLNFECSLEGYKDGEPLHLQTLAELLNIIDSLSKESKNKLAICHRRVLDIGYDSAPKGFLYTNIPNAILARIVNLGFDLNVSIYGNEIEKNT